MWCWVTGISASRPLATDPDPVRDIGVMGGMFDPVHEGHLRAGREALSALGLDEVRLMPCARPVHRDSASASDGDRLAMLALAVSDSPGLIVDDRECRREGPSWTVTSLESLKQEFPRSRLYLLMGTDTFATLQTWHRWQELFALAHVVIIGRPGQTALPGQVLAAELARRSVTDPGSLKSCESGLVYSSLSSHTELSSTTVRSELAAGRKAEKLLPRAVLEYISTHHLYH